jgi:hypothetical protein
MLLLGLTAHAHGSLGTSADNLVYLLDTGHSSGAISHGLFLFLLTWYARVD